MSKSRNLITELDCIFISQLCFSFKITPETIEFVFNFRRKNKSIDDWRLDVFHIPQCHASNSITKGNNFLLSLFSNWGLSGSKRLKHFFLRLKSNRKTAIFTCTTLAVICFKINYWWSTNWAKKSPNTFEVAE